LSAQAIKAHTIKKKIRNDLLTQLLDRHGTGRILFRNSRNTIKGFPARKVLPAQLRMPVEYETTINEFLLTDPKQLLINSKQAKYIFTPEMLYGLEQQAKVWTDFDPRVDFLIRLLQSLKREKNISYLCTRPIGILFRCCTTH
jgi:ATP-dependent helicase HepA